MLHSDWNDAPGASTGEGGEQSRLLPSSAQGCPVTSTSTIVPLPVPSIAPGRLLVVCPWEEVCRWKIFPLSSLGACLQVGDSGPVCKVMGKRGSRQLGSSLWFLDCWFPTGNQVLELTEKHKSTLYPQLATLQVSGPVNMLDTPFCIFYLSQGFAAQDSLKNTALAVTVPCGFPVISLCGATEVFLLKVSAVLQGGSQMLCSGDKFSLGSARGCHSKFGFHLGTVLLSGDRFSFLPLGRKYQPSLTTAWLGEHGSEE